MFERAKSPEEQDEESLELQDYQKVVAKKLNIEKNNQGESGNL